MQLQLQRMAERIRLAFSTSSRRSDRGASVIEYALLLALIAVVCIGAVTYFGTGTDGGIEGSTNSMISAGF